MANEQIKKLLKEVQALREKEQTREVKVEARQSEVVWTKNLIHHVQQKIQLMAQEMEARPSKNIHSNHVEQLDAQVEEVTVNVSRVQHMFEEFQDKFGPPTQPDLEPEQEA